MRPAVCTTGRTVRRWSPAWCDGQPARCVGPRAACARDEQGEFGRWQCEFRDRQPEFDSRQRALGDEHRERSNCSSLAGVKGARAGRGTTSRPSRSSPGGTMQLKHLNILDTVRRVQGFLSRRPPHSARSSLRRSARGWTPRRRGDSGQVSRRRCGHTLGSLHR